MLSKKYRHMLLHNLQVSELANLEWFFQLLYLYALLENKVKIPECRWWLKPLQASLYVWEHAEEWRGVECESTCYYVEIIVIPKLVMCLRTKALYMYVSVCVCELRSIPVFVHYGIER